MNMKPWTYSALSGFESCPQRFYRLRVKQDIVEPPSEHITWGNTVHKAFENAVNTGTPMPEEMKNFESMANKLRALPGSKLCEVKLAVDRAYKIVDWWSPDVWCRGVADLMIVDGDVVSVIDYKTGKRRPTEQLQLYAGFTFSKYPEAQRVDTGFLWLKDKSMDKETFTRDDVPRIWNGFIERSAKLEKAYENNEWAPRPSGLCNGWCPVTDCVHCRRKK